MRSHIKRKCGDIENRWICNVNQHVHISPFSMKHVTYIGTLISLVMSKSSGIQPVC